MLRLSQVSSVVFYWVGNSHPLFHRQVVEFPQILSRSSLEEMWRPVVAMNAEPGYLQYMGLSFFLDQRTGPSGTTTFIGHTGSQAGFRAFVEFNPTNRKAVIAALNTSHASGHSESETDRAHRSRDGFNALREQAFALLQ